MTSVQIENISLAIVHMTLSQALDEALRGAEPLKAVHSAIVAVLGSLLRQSQSIRRVRLTTRSWQGMAQG